MVDQPAWIERCIIRNDLPWEKSEKYGFSNFTKKYTLNDSGYKNTKDIQRGIQRSILKSDLKSVGKDQLLVISDKYGGNAKIIFNGECRFLVLDEDKQIIRV